jgi:hypothetical protein
LQHQQLYAAVEGEQQQVLSGAAAARSRLARTSAPAMQHLQSVSWGGDRSIGGTGVAARIPSLAGGPASSASLRFVTEGGAAPEQQEQQLGGLAHASSSSGLPPLAEGVPVQLGAEGLQSAGDETQGATVDDSEPLQGVLVVAEQLAAGAGAAAAAPDGRQALEQQQWEQHAAAAVAIAAEDEEEGGAHSNRGGELDSLEPLTRLTTYEALAALQASTDSNREQEQAALEAAFAGGAAPAEPGNAAWGPRDRQLMAAMLAQLHALRAELDTLRRRSYT